MSEPRTDAGKAAVKAIKSGALAMWADDPSDPIATMIADVERAASERPPVDPLREAALRLFDTVRLMRSTVAHTHEEPWPCPVYLVDEAQHALAAIVDPTFDRPYPPDLADLHRQRIVRDASPAAQEDEVGPAVTVDWTNDVIAHLERQVAELRAASPAAPRPEGLDEERLARAMDAVFAAGSDFELQHVSKPHPVLAGRIAREYARLSDTGDTPES